MTDVAFSQHDDDAVERGSENACSTRGIARGVIAREVRQVGGLADLCVCSIQHRSRRTATCGTLIQEKPLRSRGTSPAASWALLLFLATPALAEPTTRPASPQPANTQPASPTAVMTDLLDFTRVCDAGSCLALVANIDDLDLQRHLSGLIDKFSSNWKVAVVDERIDGDRAVVILRTSKANGETSYEPIPAIRLADGWKLILTANVMPADAELAGRARQLADEWGQKRVAELLATTQSTTAPTP